jgi:hypothetical protein
VPKRVAFEYALIRLVPSNERGECLNAGVMLICRPRRFLKALVSLDRNRLLALAPRLDADTLDAIERQLQGIVSICAGLPEGGPIAALSQSERWHWLTAPTSTIVQPGLVHTGLSVDPNATLDHLFTVTVLLDS